MNARILSAAKNAARRLDERHHNIFVVVDARGNLRGCKVGDYFVDDIDHSVLMSAESKILGFSVSTIESDVRLVMTELASVTCQNGVPAYQLDLRQIVMPVRLSDTHASASGADTKFSP